MDYIIQQILENLKNVGLGCGIFVISYLSNMILGLWYNIKVLNQEFDYHRLINSALKILAFVFGTSLLAIGITLVPIFADYVGVVIPEEYTDVLQAIAIVSLFIICSCKYLVEAYNKFRAILFGERNV